jgi:transcription initiation factor TFIID TATA-box-binding protein
LNPKIRNIVVTASLGSSLNLDGLALASNVIYEPEQFPAVILSLKEPYKASILIFASGKVVITGLKNSEQIEPIMKKLQHFIETNQY